MGASAKRHRLGRSSHRKPKERHHQQTYPSRRSRRTFYDQEPSHPSNYPHLTTLPPELQLSIFETLDPVSSTCLGLTSRKLYPMHRARHKKVGLYEGSYDSGRPLCVLLKDWAPDNLMLDWESERLVSKDKYNVLQAERQRQGRTYWESSVPVHTPKIGYSRKYGHEEYYEEPRSKPRLRRQRRFVRHDIWYSGRR